MDGGMVYLIGAGPGDPGLITVRGREALMRADVVLYDRLGTEALMHLVRADAELIDVGKAPGQVAMTQDETTALLVRLGQQGKVVARLKGGDPFVFGRGAEEAEALVRAGVRVLVTRPQARASASTGIMEYSRERKISWFSWAPMRLARRSNQRVVLL